MPEKYRPYTRVRWNIQLPQSCCRNQIDRECVMQPDNRMQHSCTPGQTRDRISTALTTRHKRRSRCRWVWSARHAVYKTSCLEWLFLMEPRIVSALETDFLGPNLHLHHGRFVYANEHFHQGRTTQRYPIVHICLWGYIAGSAGSSTAILSPVPLFARGVMRGNWAAHGDVIFCFFSLSCGRSPSWRRQWKWAAGELRPNTSAATEYLLHTKRFRTGPVHSWKLQVLVRRYL